MPKVHNVASRRAQGSRAGAPRRAERPATVRLDDVRLGLVTALAVIDETTVAEQIRLASDAYIKQRLNDTELAAKVEAAVERYRQGFSSLLEGEPSTPAEQERTVSRDLQSEKQVTLRLEQRTIDFCTSLALLDGTTLADQLRASIDVYTEARLQDPELDRRTKAARQDQDELLARLAKSA